MVSRAERVANIVQQSTDCATLFIFFILMRHVAVCKQWVRRSTGSAAITVQQREVVFDALTHITAELEELGADDLQSSWVPSFMW